MLNELKKDLEREAMCAPEYKREDRSTDLIGIFADKYCAAVDNGESRDAGIYLSCLILKFWNRITDLYAGKDKHYGEQISFLVSNNQITIEDVFYKIYDCILTALNYRTWKNQEKHTTAQACINQIISTRAAGELLRPFNLKKNEGMLYTRSLDESIDDGEGKLTLGDTIADESSASSEDTQAVYEIVQSAIDDNKIVEAIIFDQMAFNDCQKVEKTKLTQVDSETGEEKEVSRQVTSFWAHKLVKELSDLGDNFKKYFMNTYEINGDKLEAALNALKKANNQKKYRMIEAARNYGKEILINC